MSHHIPTLHHVSCHRPHNIIHLTMPKTTSNTYTCAMCYTYMHIRIPRAPIDKTVSIRSSARRLRKEKQRNWAKGINPCQDWYRLKQRQNLYRLRTKEQRQARHKNHGTNVWSTLGHSERENKKDFQRMHRLGLVQKKRWNLCAATMDNSKTQGSCH